MLNTEVDQDEFIVNQINDELEVVTKRPKHKLETCGIYARLSENGKWTSHLVTYDVYLHVQKVNDERECNSN